MKKIICITLLALLCLTLCSCNSEENTEKHTVTFYNNTGINYYYNSSGESRIRIYHQDNSVYKVETFSGGYPSEPMPPTNEGYVFLGWYQNPECTEEFLFGYYQVNSDINLYAKWGH